MSITNELKLKKVEILIFNSKILFYRGEFNDFQNLVAKEGFDISFEEDNSDGLSFDFEVSINLGCTKCSKTCRNS